jgi:TfoX/Sxy family transcriptional regulator of competence genes
MASDLNFVEYVRDQINGAGEGSFKKMFGKYAIYYDNKVINSLQNKRNEYGKEPKDVDIQSTKTS